MAPSGSSPLPAAASSSDGPQATDAHFFLLQALYGQLTARVMAVEKDVGRALSEHERQIHRERLAELRADRETVVAYLDALERARPLPGPWPIELCTADLTIRAASASGLGRRPVFHVPVALPPNYVPRPELLAEVRRSLLARAGDSTFGSQVDALHGMGGIGKSVLARALCDDPELQAAFPDGILWATLGQAPDLTARLREWIDALGGVVGDTAPTVDRLKAILADLLRARACLLIADDVWTKAHAEALRVGGPGCRLLLTTRDAAVAEELGAAVHLMPAMAEAEAVALLERWAGDGLRDVHPELKASVVRGLGRLPLAIKLAGAQLQRKDAQRWLDTFDARKLQMRRVEVVHDSLAATFALSLDGLSTTGRPLYLALAIFPPDEPTPVAAIARLWAAQAGYDPDETLDLVEDLAARALVQHAGQESDAVLLHGLLRELMAAELGKDGRQAAHQALLAAYRQTQRGPGWSTAPDDGYLHDHLAYHLAQLAGQDSAAAVELHSLFTSQAWFQTRAPQAGARLDGYLADLALAWEQAAQAVEHTPAAVAALGRYALIRSSLLSLATALPPALLAALVQHQLWTADQALSYVSHAFTAEQASDCLAAVAPLLPPAAWPRAVQIAQAIGDPYRRSDALVALAQHAPPALCQEIAGAVLADLPSQPYISSRTHLLTVLAPVLPASLLDTAWEAALALPFVDARGRAVAALLPRLPADRLPQAGEVVALLSAQPGTPEAVQALAALAARLPHDQQLPLFAQALDLIAAWPDGNKAGDLLAGLALNLPAELLPRGLALVRALASPFGQVQAVAAYLSRCQGDAQADLAVLGLAAAGRLPGGSDPETVRWLVAFLPALPPSLAGRVYQAALDAARQVDPPASAADLARLLPWAPAADRPALADEIFTTALQHCRGYRGASALAAAAPMLASGQQAELLAAALALDDPGDRIVALTGLSSSLSADLLAPALEAAGQLSDDEQRFRLLAGLAPWLPTALLPRALALAQAQHDEAERASALVALAELAAPPDFPLAAEALLVVVASVPQAEQRARLLHRLMAWLPAPVQDAARSHLLDALRACKPYDLIQILQRLAPGLNAPLLAPLLALVDALLPSDRERALAALAPALPPDRLDMLAGQAAAQIASGSLEQAASLLVAIAPFLPSRRRAALLQDAVGAARSAELYTQARVLSQLAPLLDGDLLAEARRLADQQPRAEPRAALLTALLPCLPAAQQPAAAGQLAALAAEVGAYAQREEIIRAIAGEGLATPALAAALAGTARAIPDPGYRVRALAALLPCVAAGQQAALAQEILSTAQGSDRLEVLAQLAPYRVLAPGWEEAFWSAYRGAYAHHAAQALIHVQAVAASEARPSYLAQAAGQLARWNWTRDASRGAHDRAPAWRPLVAAWQELPPAAARSVWRDALPALATRSRADLYLDLTLIAPVLPALAGQGAAAEIARTILDVSAWWP